MLATVKSATPYGIDGLACEVEVDLSPGLPKVVTVGLPDTAVGEGQDRVRAAGLSASASSGVPSPSTSYAGQSAAGWGNSGQRRQ